VDAVQVKALDSVSPRERQGSRRSASFGQVSVAWPPPESSAVFSQLPKFDRQRGIDDIRALSWHFESLVGEQFRRRGQARGWRHVPREVQGVVLKFPDPEYRCI
jgi:hypothetical protein